MLKAPGVDDLAELFRIHRAHVGKYARAGRAKLPEKGQELAYLFSKMAGNLEYMVGQGYMYKDYDKREYRFTWKGAALFAWPSMLPLKPILNLSSRQRAKALLQSKN